MVSIHPNLLDFKYVSASVFALAALATCLRLCIRLKKWWWDDTLACVSMVCMAIFVAGASVLAEGAAHPRSIQILAYYLVVLGYYIPIWSARLSILFTIIRIAPWPRQRKILMGCAAFFLFQWVFLMIQVFWVCEIASPAWKEVEGELCILGMPVAISQVITTVTSDVVLILAPLWIIRRVTLNPSLRFRLVSAFFISVATTAAALVHSVLVIRAPGAWEAIFGAIEVAAALTVCNASVLIPFVARKFTTRETFQGSEPDPEVVTIGGSGTSKKRNNSIVLTTLHIADMMTTTNLDDSVKVEVTVADHDLDNPGTWDRKKSVSGDGNSSFESPTRDFSDSPV